MVAMHTVHKTTIVGKCPKGCADIYDAEFRDYGDGSRVIEVEAIQAAIDKHTQLPIYQESLTKALAEELECIVETKGRHGNFSTTCTVYLQQKKK